MAPRTRYQGAIIRDHQVLLFKQIEHASGRSYWQIPGGRIAPVETEGQSVRRGCPLGHAGGDGAGSAERLAASGRPSPSDSI
jgi:hypothetical protein